MKTIKFTFSVALLVLNQIAFAQTGSWKLAGNSLAGTEKIGSKNNFPINFITNNVTRMSLTPTGQLGIGTSAPEGNLHIFRGSAGTVTANPNAPLVVENSTDNFINLLTPSNKSSAILFGNPLLAEDGGIIYNNPTTVRGFQFNTSNITRMVLTNSGSLGVGITNPKGPLHVFSGISGITPLPSSIITESGSNNFISLLAPSSKETGILFATGTSNQDGAIVFNNPAVPHGMQFNTAGITRMTVTANGRLGIGTIAPSTEMHLLHGDGENSTHGLRLQNNGANGVNWTLYASNSDGDLDLFAKNNLIGFFDDASGDYSSLSDARRKKDIEKSPDILDKVLQLDVKKYHFLESKSADKKHYGMIAQDVEKIFPEVVYHKKMDGNEGDLYTMNYSAFGVLAIKAIQEQQKKIEEQERTNEKQQNIIERQQATIEKLQSDIEDLKKMIGISSATTNLSSNISKEAAGSRAAHLNQNAPNPFNTATVISYYLPETKQNASIEIVSSSGQPIKTFLLTQKGNAQLSIKAGELSVGTYYYTLKVDGVKVDSKQMLVVK